MTEYISIQATIIVPNIEKKSTAEARAVLPPSYSRAEAVFNIQRASLLTSLFTKPQQVLIQFLYSLFNLAYFFKLFIIY